MRGGGRRRAAVQHKRTGAAGCDAVGDRRPRGPRCGGDRLAGVRLCGDYAPLRQQFIKCYFGFIAGHLNAHRDELAERAKPYDGLYAPEDWLWSALRPLPRGWVPVQGQLLSADMVFWDGTQPVAVELAARETDRQKALRQAGVMVCRIEPSVLGGDPMQLGQISAGEFFKISGTARRCRPARSAV